MIAHIAPSQAKPLPLQIGGAAGQSPAASFLAMLGGLKTAGADAGAGMATQPAKPGAADPMPGTQAETAGGDIASAEVPVETVALAPLTQGTNAAQVVDRDAAGAPAAGPAHAGAAQPDRGPNTQATPQTGAAESVGVEAARKSVTDTMTAAAGLERPGLAIGLAAAGQMDGSGIGQADAALAQDPNGSGRQGLAMMLGEGMGGTGGSGTSGKPGGAFALAGLDLSSADQARAAVPELSTAAMMRALAAAPPSVDPLASLEALSGLSLQSGAGAISGGLDSLSGQAPQPQAASHSGQMQTPPAIQVGLQIAKAVVNGETRFTVRMDPPELGRVQVKLELGPDGAVRAMILADTKDALDMLQREGRLLERALNEAGLKADSGSLSFSLNQGQDQGGHARVFADMQSNGGMRDEEGLDGFGDEQAAAGQDGGGPVRLSVSGGLDITI